MSVRVTDVVKGSPADKAHIKKGDILEKINGNVISDVLDYMYYSAESTVRLTLRRDDSFLLIKIRKSEYDDLGMEFRSFLMDEKQSCCNKCVFCFIDQMPPNMRDTLYFKDDDARLSFLQGNYVTLTNLKQKDIDRIIKMRLNINVSVHTTNPELRCKMMNNRFAGEKLSYLWQLAEGGIMLNCQIVLCPGLNDNEELERTLNDLSELMPNISSIAVVPVGLTKFREGLYPLTLFDKEGAAKNVEIIEKYQQKFLEKYGTRLVFPSDELYILSGKPIPDNEYYEDYSQYENGVGMLRSLEDEFSDAFDELCREGKKYPQRRVTMATGALAYDFIKEMGERVNNADTGVRCDTYKIINYFFGETITVTGLLTAQDIIAQLKDKELGDVLILSSAMIKKDSDLFLDDMTISDVEKALDIKIVLTDNDGRMLLESILGISAG
ncbi:MAG: DUF512 domain-containing protein [Oscillospiraceae bacterium]|nr:DUF512 domain-containing protein [Oscillospiraceae bacterium]